MIIEFRKINNFYDDLKNNLYGNISNSDYTDSTDIDDSTNDIYISYNFIPIIINDKKYILTNTNDLEGYLYEYKKNIDVNIYINDGINIEKIEYRIKKLVIFGENNKIDMESSDAYIDFISDLIIIKFEHSKLNYINIFSDINFNCDLRPKLENIKLKYFWTNENLCLEQLTKSTKLLNVWMDDYINLPPVPKMIDLNNFANDKIPISGSSVYDQNDNIIGIVSHINRDGLVITPLISIKKIANNLITENLLYLGIDIYPIKFNLNNFDYSNGLLITNNYYNNIASHKNKLKKKINKMTESDDETNNPTNNPTNNLISDESNNQISDLHEPQSDKQNNRLEQLSNIESCPEKKVNIDISKYKEKYDSIINTDVENLKYLKKGNIICSVDNYKINSDGFIFRGLDDNLKDNLEDNLQSVVIPFKSYLWFFKNTNCNVLNLDIFPVNNLKIDLTKIINFEDKIHLNELLIKKNKITNTNIVLKSDFKNISIYEYSTLKNVVHKKLKIVELNEKILELLRPFFSENKNLYLNIIKHIFNNKYTYENKKILLFFSFDEKKLPIVKIIPKKINNFDELINIYKTKKQQNEFMLNIK